MTIGIRTATPAAVLAQQRGSEALLVENQYKEAWRDATAPLTLEQL